ncbi:hypothetical protein B0H11DRAFT_1908571 [Mycena galericulata]|nr:hypothetical protein B0H11DRAFT_1908571 [Mycena galericulata]
MEALPDEIHLTILSFFFRSLSPVSSFTDLRRHKPSVDTTQLSVLSVFKAWRRVGVPLAYESVIVHTTVQAQALVATLRGEHGPGLHIRNLMLLGGFGRYSGMILDCTPCLRRLRLTLYLAAEDKVSGLVRALPLVNPDEVIVYQHARRDSRHRFHVHRNGPLPWMPERKNEKELAKAVATCIQRSWSNLRIFRAAFRAPGQPSIAPLARALASLPTLTTIHIPTSAQLPHYLLTITKNPSLQNVVVANDMADQRTPDA